MIYNPEKKTILVTGGYGFIMSNLINLLNLNNYNSTIINVDKCGAGSNKANILPATNNNNIINIHLECENPKFVKILKEYKPDAIIHGAAESHVDRSITDPLGFVKGNVLGTSNVVHALDWYQKNVKPCRAVFVSTDEVYGHLGPNEEPWTEDSPIAPRSPYASSKAGADMIALSFYNTFKTDFCIVRGCNNFGPRQDTEKLIPKYITNLLKGEKMPVYGTGTNIREWVFVDDFCLFILDRLGSYSAGKVYNYGCGVSKNNLELLNEVYNCMEQFCKKRDCKLESKFKTFEDSLQYVEDRKGHDFRYAMKSNHIYGHQTEMSFRKRLMTTIEFYYNECKQPKSAKKWFGFLR